MRLSTLLILAALVCSAHAQITRDMCTIIVNKTLTLPAHGVVGGNPERIELLATQHFDAGSARKVVDFRGYQVWTGTYQGQELFAATHLIGGPSAVFILEELVAHGIKTVIRLGTSDLDISGSGAGHVVNVIKSEAGDVGLMRGYGWPPSTWERETFFPHPDVYNTLIDVAHTTPNITVKSTPGYALSGYFPFNYVNSSIAYNVANVKSQEAAYHARYGDELDRDMECSGVLMLAAMRNLRAGCVLQAVKKGGGTHANPGTQGIPVVLNTLLQLAQKNL